MIAQRLTVGHELIGSLKKKNSNQNANKRECVQTEPSCNEIQSNHKNTVMVKKCPPQSRHKYSFFVESIAIKFVQRRKTKSTHNQY